MTVSWKHIQFFAKALFVFTVCAAIFSLYVLALSPDRLRLACFAAQLACGFVQYQLLKVCRDRIGARRDG